jgi:hypothetical protein
MTKSLNLDDFKLFQAVFEARYEKAYFLWDKSGEVWTAINQEWHTLKAEIIEPNNTTFLIDNKFQISVNIDKTSVIDLKPSSSLNDFTEVANKAFNIITTILRIEKFNRIGFRLIFIRDFPDKESSANAFIDTNLITIPKGKHFNIEGKVLLPTYKFNWESKSTTVRISLEVRDRKIDFDAHPSLDEIDSLHITKHELVYDIDYYTLDIVSIGQLNIKEWITQTYHIIKRDSRNILGGI